MAQEKEYFAFISYQRKDEKWAKWLAKELEHYHLPTTLNGKNLPKNLRPIFRDVDELSAGNLPEQIYHALSISKNLIVVCSPRSAKSEWVNKEIEDFINIKGGKADSIYPFIIEGIPFSKDAEKECFPEKLRNLPVNEERLGGNINEQGGRNAAVVKIIAGMLGVGFDSLWQKYEREQIRKRNRTIAVLLLFLFTACGIAGWMINKDWKMMKIQSRAVVKQAEELIEQGDSHTASLILLGILPKEGVWPFWPNRPYTVEAEAALRKASDYNSGVFVGHTDIVNSVHYNSDENLIVSASSDKTIKVWDALTAKEIYTLNNHSKPVIEALFSPDGNWIVSAEEGGVIRIWDTKSKKCTRLLQRHNEEICNLSFDKEGKHFMSVSKNKIVVWNVKDGKVFNEIQPIKKTTKALFYPNGLDVVSLSDNVFYIWDISSASLKRTIECPIERSETLDRLKLDSYLTLLHSFAFSPHGNLIICSDKVGKIYILDLEHGKVIDSFVDEGGTVEQFAIFNENKLIVSTTPGHSIITIRDRDGNQIRSLVGHKGEVTSIETGPCRGRIISSSKDHTIRQWDLCAYIKSVSTEGHYGQLSTLSKDFKFYADADFNTADMTVWNTKDGSCYKKMKGVYACQYLTFSLDNTLLAIVGQRDPYHFSLKDATSKSMFKTYIFDVKSKKLQGVIDAEGKMTFSSNNDRIACGVDSTVCIFDTKTSNLKKKFKGHSKRITAITYSPNGKYIASGSLDKTVRIWDVNTGNCLHVLYSHSEEITSIVYSPDSDIIISVSQDNTIKLWNPITGCLLYTLKGHTGKIESANFSRNGKWIVSTSDDKTIKVWDVQSGCLLNTIECGYVRYNSFFSLDDKSIISLCADNKMEIYAFPPIQQLIDETRERFKNRKLTPEERRKYYLE